MNRFTLTLAALLLAGSIQAAPTTPTPVSTAADGWDYSLPGTQLEVLCETTLSQAKEAFVAIENDTSPATLQGVYGAYDQMMLDLQAIQHVWYLKSVHPDPQVQAAAEQCIEDYSDFAVT